MSVFCVAAYAATESDIKQQTLVDPNNAMDFLMKDVSQDSNLNNAKEKIKSGGKSVHTIFQSILFIASFIILMVYGAQWILFGKDSQKKKELKEAMGGYAIGFIFTFGTAFIYRIVMSFVGSFN